MIDRKDAMDHRKTAAQDQQALEVEQDRLARFAGYSVVCGILSVFGVVAVFVYTISYGWWLEYIHSAPVPVSEVYSEIWKILVFVASLGIVVASYGALIYGRMGCRKRNSYNRTLAFVGIALGFIGFLAGTLLTLAFSPR